MSATQQSSVALRIIIVGEAGYPSVTNPSDALTTVNTSELPDGAQAFVLSTRVLYRLNKLSTQTPLGNGAFIPASGEGVWVFESGPGNPFETQVTGTASLTGAQAVTQNQWIALPSGSSFYSTGFGGSVFAVNSTTGVVTYSGPSGLFKVTATATLACATVSQAMELAISQSSATLIGQTTFDGTAGAASADPTTVNLGECISTTKFVTLANNETLQAVMRNTTGTPGNLNATHLNLVIEPA